MGLLGSLLGLVLLLFLLVLIARAVLDWAGVLTSSSSEGVRRAREVTYRLTEPVIAPAYDDGTVSEAEVRALHTARFARLAEAADDGPVL